MAARALDRGPREQSSDPAAALLLLALPLAVFAQPHLQEYQPRGEDKAEPDEDQGQDLPRAAAQQCPEQRSDYDQQARGAKAQDARATGHP